MKIASAAVVAVFSLSGWAIAAPATPIPPEIDVMQRIASAYDDNEDGIATKDEVMAVAEAEFANSDADGDGFVTGRDLAFGSPTFAAFIFGAGPAK